MYGQGFGTNPLQEAVTDAWINQNIPGGVNSKIFFFFLTMLLSYLCD